MHPAAMLTGCLLAVAAVLRPAHTMAQAATDAFAQQVGVPLGHPPGVRGMEDVAVAGGQRFALAGAVLWRHGPGRWERVPRVPGGVTAIHADGDALVLAGQAWAARLVGKTLEDLALPPGAEVAAILQGAPLRLLTRTHVLTRAGSSWIAREVPPGTTAAAQAADGTLALVATGVVHEWAQGGHWAPVPLRHATEGWDPPGVSHVAYDTRGRLWFASAQGVGVRDAAWRFIDPARGLPVLGITSMAAGPDGAMWLGTTRGAIRLSDAAIEYRQGRRWLPGDQVRAVDVDAAGHAWFATDEGIGAIETREMTLAAKARAYEEAIAAYHLRTPLGYVVEAHLTRRGDPSSAVTRDNDNDGLWTGMYGAAQCFAYAATGSDGARTRARRVFEALRFLADVTQGGPHAPPDGFPARSILPATGPDPNVQDSPARDRQMQERDARWKVLSPRWPRSADGRWYWKADTSSDELDGHYFFYALYHDLVARDAQERADVAAVVRRITDHLLAHAYRLVDHDGQPTRWAVFAPDALNTDRLWYEERGLNSLSMLTYLRIAHHVTGDERYDAAGKDLVARHGYAINLMQPKVTLGVGGGNQSDDEMAFMNFYHLLEYEREPAVLESAARALHAYWQLERPERNPFFNLVAATSLEGRDVTDAYGTETLTLPDAQWRGATLDTLRRFPVDLVDWGLSNSHRLDVRPLEPHVRPGADRTHAVGRDGMVLPVDERMVFHWNVDPYALDYAGTGARLADGTSFLLPYYMALYHRVITAPDR